MKKNVNAVKSRLNHLLYSISGVSKALFSAKCLFVEGKTDEIFFSVLQNLVISHYSKVKKKFPSEHVDKFIESQIISIGGKNNADFFRQLISFLEIPSKFIFDGDVLFSFCSQENKSTTLGDLHEYLSKNKSNPKNKLTDLMEKIKQPNEKKFKISKKQIQFFPNYDSKEKEVNFDSNGYEEIKKIKENIEKNSSVHILLHLKFENEKLIENFVDMETFIVHENSISKHWENEYSKSPNLKLSSASKDKFWRDIQEIDFSKFIYAIFIGPFDQDSDLHSLLNFLFDDKWIDKSDQREEAVFTEWLTKNW